ncbi:fluoride efflux transporter FluC [Nocardioides sp. GCM10027113]|uniref:fluoride efflux transporter FluC n=1 Tax=unclassified Nocardioides TaxID=2615069 RepID=UPI00360DC4F1
MTPLLVALGAGLGAVCRLLAAHHMDGVDGRVPWGTFGVNVAGSFLLGAFSAMVLDDHLWALVGVGFSGGLTTFSAFAVQAVERGRALGTAYVASTVLAGLVACAAGFALYE